MPVLLQQTRSAFARNFRTPPINFPLCARCSRIWISGSMVRLRPTAKFQKLPDNTAVFATVNPATEAIAIGSVSQIALGFPTIPGLNFDGLITIHNVWDWGPQFDQGIITVVPPKPTGKVYPNFVSKVDVDGNELAGIRLPPVSVPVATTAGWNHRATAFGGPDGCESSGLLVRLRPIRPLVRRSAIRASR